MTELLRRSKYKLGLEMIEFQKDNFGFQLEAAISKIKSKIENDPTVTGRIIQDFEEVKEIESIVHKRLNLVISLDTKGHALAAILPFYSNKNHIFIHEFFRGNFYINDQERLLAKIENKKGYVDLEKARLGGIFSEYVNKVYLDFKSLFSLGLSSSEVTGVLLHELGHGFEVCEYSDRTSSANQVLIEIAKKIQGKKELDLEYVYREITGKIDKNYTEKQLDDLVNGNRIVAGVEWFKLMITASGQAIRSQQENGRYDDNSFEQLADNFANRFGYGRALITGLDKITKKYGSIDKNKSTYVFSIMMESLVLGAAVALVIIGIPIIIKLYVLIFMSLVILSAGDEYRDHTYDDLKKRYLRVRSDLIEVLKDQDIDSSYSKSVVDDIKLLDSIIDETGDRKSVYNLLSNFFIGSNRRAKKAIYQQHLLEQLASNDLFLKSAELKV